MERYIASIFKNSIMKNQGRFQTEAERDGWLTKHIAKNTFGLPERPELVMNEESGEMEETGVILLAEYEVVLEDIGAQLEQRLINEEAQALLDNSDWKILRHLREQALSMPTSLSQEEFLALEQQRADAAASIIK